MSVDPVNPTPNPETTPEAAPPLSETDQKTNAVAVETLGAEEELEAPPEPLEGRVTLEPEPEPLVEKVAAETLPPAPQRPTTEILKLAQSLPTEKSVFVKEVIVLMQSIVLNAQRELARKDRLDEKQQREKIDRIKDEIREEREKEASITTEKILELEKSFEEANIQTREQLLSWVIKQTEQYHEEMKHALATHHTLVDSQREADLQELTTKFFMYRGQLTLMDKILTETLIGKKYGVDVLGEN